MVCKVYCPTAIEQDIGVVPEEGYNPYFFPVDGAYLPFFFTEDTFLRVFSALCNGAYTTYGDEGRAVIWEFLRNVEYPVSLCEQIAECIATNEATQAAIRAFVTEDEGINNHFTDLAQGVVGELLTGELIYGSCDNSELAGKMITLVARLDQNNKDAFEIIEVGTNDEEKVSLLIEGIPIVGEAPVDQIIDFLQDLLEDFAENYDAASTFERLDDLARDLYCFAKDKPECALSYADLFEFFQARVSSGLTLLSLVGDVLNFVIDGDFDTDDLVFNGMMAMQIAFIRAGKDFFGIDAPRIGTLTRDALPSSAWEDWDACPTTWCRHLNAANDLDTLFVGNGGLGAQAVWTGTGWARNDAVAPGRITIGADMGASYQLTSIRIVRTAAWAGGNTNDTVLYAPTFATVIETAEIPEDLTFNVSLNVQTFNIDEVSSTDAYADPIGGEITDIYISGEGSEPTWGEAC